MEANPIWTVIFYMKQVSQTHTLRRWELALLLGVALAALLGAWLDSSQSALADQVMEAARTAGAKGGTVINARRVGFEDVQNVLGFSATISGLATLPGAVLGAAMGLFAGRVFDKSGVRGIAIAGAIVLTGAASGCSSSARARPSSSSSSPTWR